MPYVLGLNGNAVTMRPDLARRVGEPGKLGDPTRVGAAFRVVAHERQTAGARLRFGVVHRHSSHN